MIWFLALLGACFVTGLLVKKFCRSSYECTIVLFVTQPGESESDARSDHFR